MASSPSSLTNFSRQNSNNRPNNLGGALPPPIPPKTMTSPLSTTPPPLPPIPPPTLIPIQVSDSISFVKNGTRTPSDDRDIDEETILLLGSSPSSSSSEAWKTVRQKVRIKFEKSSTKSYNNDRNLLLCSNKVLEGLVNFIICETKFYFKSFNEVV